MGLLHGKSPVVASLDIAELHINKQGTKEFVECSIAGGLLYVTPEKVEIITDAIEEKNSIDVNRAEKAKRLAELELKNKKESVEYHLAGLSLKRAINRLRVRES